MPTLMFIQKETLEDISDSIREIMGNEMKRTVPNGFKEGIVQCNKKGKDDMLEKEYTHYDFWEESNLQGYGMTYGDYAFAGNKNLVSAVINRRADVPNYCFLDCTSLTSVSWADGHDFIKNKGCFKNCSSLQSITMLPNPTPSAVIGEEAFSGCTSLETAEFSSSGSLNYQGVGNRAFYDCSSLGSFSFGNYVKTIGAEAFMNSGLTTVDINERYSSSGVTIGENAFRNCTDLVSVSLASNHNMTLGAYCFAGDTALQTVTLSENLVSIPAHCFDGCTSLKRVVIPASITSIGEYAFNGCTDLEEVIFSDSSVLTTIGSRAFNGCSSLLRIVIPRSVTQIGTYAFANCDSMEYIRMLPTTPPTAGSYIFYQTIDNPLTIYVPASENNTVLSAYQSATNWKISSYKSHMAVWSGGN